MSTRPSDLDSLPCQVGEPIDWHVRDKTEDGYPLMGPSPAERMAATYRAAEAKRASMRDHPFVGEGRYCESWSEPRSSGDPAGTGVITMLVGCGWSRNMHPEAV